MQMRKFQLQGDRPQCQVDPHHSVHVHGHYDRWANCDDAKREDIPRWLCVPCGHTISVLPEGMLPYRPISVPLVQAHFDAKASGQPEPAVTEKERGCLKRAWHRFTRRLAALTAVLGQIMQIRKSDAKQTWLRLRRLGNLEAILLRLARPFNTSLLHDYLCLRPWAPTTG